MRLIYVLVGGWIAAWCRKEREEEASVSSSLKTQLEKYRLGLAWHTQIVICLFVRFMVPCNDHFTSFPNGMGGGTGRCQKDRKDGRPVGRSQQKQQKTIDLKFDCPDWRAQTRSC